MPGLAATSPAPSESQEKKPLKPCCACPETKKARDAWLVRTYLPLSVLNAYFINKYILIYSIIEKGEEQCGHLIEAHKECMRALGFKI
ncbi:Cytochrome c oxidase copper chaperone [Bos mutus]|uniref:Cytochrome c oxidase copper chaperone n=1 Tax=Bos mutus TaxID=72004 RepID=L8HZF9_9CETA|nr:Cytochrome c oxidase copper chaperone [Bos mutus]